MNALVEIFINAEFGDDIPDFNVIEGGLEMCPRPRLNELSKINLARYLLRNLSLSRNIWCISP